ncbi:extracellular solute-binding protein [Rhizobium terrae]|uniref:extracellular solute-binding protein n=1 Tax=Rhizobium terrae TaxID=2171756 RepID=UPI000E3E4F33|nr:extracellular solute-binding protein [Rhizobium terrae]
MKTSIPVTRRQILAGAAAAGSAVALPSYLRAQSSVTEIEVQYQSPVVFDPAMKEIATAFSAANPNIRVKYRAPEPGYPELLQRSLRDSITGTLPDVGLHGLNRQRALLDRNLPVDLTPFLKSDPKVAELGYKPALLSVGQLEGKQVGIAFGMSQPVFYFNADLVKKAGGDPQALPADWNGLIELAKAIDNASTNTKGMFYRWSMAGDWAFQALIRSHGGEFVDKTGTKVRFTEEPGQKALQLLQRFVDEARMKDLSDQVMYQEMFSGRLGFMNTSSAELGRFHREIGNRFPLVGASHPISADNGTVPAGGCVAMMFSKGEAKQAAAWEFIKFATGPIGASSMVKHLGYIPSTTVPAEREDMLAKLYRDDPLQKLGASRTDKITGWFEFPGQNGLKITQTIVDGLYPVLTGKKSGDQALADLGQAVQGLLPHA